MTKALGSAAALAACLVLPACGRAGPVFDAGEWRAALAEIVAAERAFAALAADSTVQHAFEANIAPEGILFRPDPVPGAAALAAQPMPEGLALLWDPAFADVSRAGDLGYTTGPWRSGRRGAPPDSIRGGGQYVTLWRRTPAGLRFVLDIGIGHDPAAASLPATLEQAAVADAVAPGSASADTGTARESLRIADEDLGAALAGSDFAAYRSYAGERVRVLRDGQPPAFGPDALTAAAPAVPVRSLGAGASVSVSNDLGYTWGSLQAAGDSVGTPLGHFLRIWRRQADGSWKLVLDLVTA
jgi:ketosteroid isomerase-like protein